MALPTPESTAKEIGDVNAALSGKEILVEHPPQDRFISGHARVDITSRRTVVFRGDNNPVSASRYGF